MHFEWFSMVPDDVVTFAEQICHVAFALDKTADLVEERFELSRSSPYDIKVMLQNGIQQISEKVKKSLLLIKLVASAIRTPRFVECLLNASPAGALLDHVLVSLSLDEIHIETVKRQEYVFRNIESREIRTGAGPLSAVFNRVQWCRSSISSLHASIQGMRENKQRQEQSLRDTLRKTPSSGILGADPMSPQSEDLQLASSAMNSLGENFVRSHLQFAGLLRPQLILLLFIFASYTETWRDQIVEHSIFIFFFHWPFIHCAELRG